MYAHGFPVDPASLTRPVCYVSFWDPGKGSLAGHATITCYEGGSSGRSIHLSVFPQTNASIWEKINGAPAKFNTWFEDNQAMGRHPDHILAVHGVNVPGIIRYGEKNIASKLNYALLSGGQYCSEFVANALEVGGVTIPRKELLATATQTYESPIFLSGAPTPSSLLKELKLLRNVSVADEVFNDVMRQYCKATQHAEDFCKKYGVSEKLSHKVTVSVPPHSRVVSGSSSSSASSSKQVVHRKEDMQNALMDEAVSDVARQFKGEDAVTKAAVTKLEQEYKESSDKPAAFLQFNKKLEEHLVKEQRFQDITFAVNNTATFLSQVAHLTGSKDLQKFAGGLSATMQAISGMRDIGNAISLISTGGLNMMSFGSLMGGAGLVLGAFSAIASIFGGDESDGLGEALEAIHSAVIGMWTEMREGFQEMRESFQETWRMLEKMEANSQARFEATIKAIEMTREDILFALSRSHNYITRQLAEFRESTEAYLSSIQFEMRTDHEDMIDQKMRQTIIECRMHIDVTSLRVKLNEYITILVDWLTVSALLPARSGVFSTEGSSIEATKRALVCCVRSRCSPLDIQLGFFASLAQELNPNIFGKNIAQLSMINPKNWFGVVNVYIKLLSIGIDNHSIPLKECESQLKKILKIADDTLLVFNRIVDCSELWQKLVIDYKNCLDELHSANVRYSTARFSESYTVAMQNQEIEKDLEALFKKLNNCYLRLAGFICLIFPKLTFKADSYIVGQLHTFILLMTDSSERNRRTGREIFSKALSDEQKWLDPVFYLSVGNALQNLSFTKATLVLKEALKVHPVFQEMRKIKNHIEYLLRMISDQDFKKLKDHQESNPLRPRVVDTASTTAQPVNPQRESVISQLMAQKEELLRRQGLLDVAEREIEAIFDLSKALGDFNYVQAHYENFSRFKK